MPDHASKSRFIIPGQKGFSQEDANWISGGATSFVHVPYMLRLSERDVPLQGNLLASLTPRLNPGGCGDPLQCGQTLGTQILDRALAGFNRLMEQGLEPVARLIWGPRGGSGTNRATQSSPLREPPITADPMALRELQRSDTNGGRSEEATPLAPDLPPPLLLQEGETLPVDPEAVQAEQVPPTDQPIPAPEAVTTPPQTDADAGRPAVVVPPPPVLPPPAPQP
jgi:hypothetical protein